MKKVVIIALIIALIVGGVAIFKSQKNNDILRIHIRANSDSVQDQNVKYVVRDKVINGIIPLIENANSKDEVKSILSKNENKIIAIANTVLEEYGMQYTSNMKLSQEYFPTRVYQHIEFKAGNYDCLILNLGTGAGANWWCVAYPPLCFIPSGENGQQDIRYSSKIYELIQGFKKNKN